MLLSNGQALWAHCSTHLHYVVREHPFGAPVLADKDLMVDFAAHTGPGDRVAIVATEPLTRNEPWQAMSRGPADDVHGRRGRDAAVRGVEPLGCAGSRCRLR